MQFRRRHAAVLAGIGALVSLGVTHAGAGKAVPVTAENSLLGVRLLDSYKSILSRFGQPAEVQVGMPVEGGDGAGGAPGGMGAPGGGMGMPGSGGGPMGPPMGMPGGMGGMMGGSAGPMGPPRGMPGMPGGMGMPGSGGPTLPGFPGGGRPGAMGMPGSGGGMPGSGGMGAPGGLGGGGAARGADTNVLPTIPGSGGGPSEETVMWYKFPQQGLFYSFLFNKQGQVIQIQAYGYKPDPKVPVNARTSKGVALGSSLGTVLKNYGWSSDGEHVGDFIVLRYDNHDRLPGGHGRLALQIQHNQVVGITLGYVK